MTAPKQRGFGSTLIERTIQAQGGKASMRYASEGLSARIRLPLAAASSRAFEISAALGAKAPQSPLQHSAKKQDLKGKRNLVIEDEALVLMDLEATLTDAGCELAGTAGMLDEAKQLCSSASCDAALLDANLAGHPVDDLALALGQRNIPFAFVTGYGPESLPNGFRDAMMLKKPFSQKDLLGLLDILLHQSSGVVPLRRKPAAP